MGKFKDQVYAKVVDAFGAENVHRDVKLSDLSRDAVTIQLPGHAPIETTVGAMKVVGARMKLQAKTKGTKMPKAAKEKPYQPAMGDNSVAADQLKAFIERIERLEGEKAALGGDIKDVYSEAKGNGFDTTVMRKLVARRRRDAAAVREEDAILELYMQALGMT